MLHEKKSGVVVLLGRPNVGKSSLLNAILGQDLSIVTPKAQTTRDQIRGIYTEPRGQIIFLDTPGVHKAKENGLNFYMMKEVDQALKNPDLILYIMDPSSKAEFEEIVIQKMLTSGVVIQPIMTKSDLPYAEESFLVFQDQWLTYQKENKNVLDPMLICSKTNDKVPELLNSVFDHLPLGPMLYDDPDQLTDRSTRFVVSEIIRKSLFMLLGDEVPYSCGVEIDQFKEGKPIKISATLWVERESQKGIVIGKQGSKIKSIGTQARKDIQKFLDNPFVRLDLRVKVLEDWTKNAQHVKRFIQGASA